MSGVDPREPMPRRPVRPTRWAIWTQPAPVVMVVLSVEILTVAVGIELGVLLSPGRTTAAAVVATVLAAAGVLHTEITQKVERSRRAVFDQAHAFTFTGVWIFCAAVVVPPAFSAAVIVVVHAHAWWRTARVRTPLYRSLFTLSTFLLGAFAAAATVHYLGAGDPSGTLGVVPVVLPALVAFAVANQLPVTGVAWLADPSMDRRTLLGTWKDNAIEMMTLCLGALTATLFREPALLILVPAPLIGLQSAALANQMRHALDTDAKTGLLTTAAWHAHAQRLLAPPPSRSAPRVQGVLMCDLDHFKQVNDRFGHLAGDQVLRAVADALRAAVRDRDLVARFGGEEFLVLLVRDPAADAAASAAMAVQVAERIRRRVAALHVEIVTPDGPLTLDQLTISIGAVSLGPDPRPVDLDQLIEDADTAVYRAKDTGRNRVVAAGRPATARPRPRGERESARP